MTIARATEDVSSAALQTLFAPERAAAQPPLIDASPLPLTAAIASLALGGAERIVLDWAEQSARQHRVRLIVLRDAEHEWLVPDGIEIVRLHAANPARLEALGREAALSGNPVIVCHLLLAHERAALTRGGARCVPVLHNDSEGWLEPASALERSTHLLAVSNAAACDLRSQRRDLACSVVHHIPSPKLLRADARAEWRARWSIPANAFVIGMIGGIKPQKAYPRALRVFATLLERRDAYLVIVGGPTGRDGPLAWQTLLAQAARLDLTARVRLAGHVPHAARCLPAFDGVLNTSRYEGLSIATLEALAAGLPVVASAVGGQGELDAPGLALVSFDARDRAWADALEAAVARRPELPAWRGFPSARLWTLFHIAQPVSRQHGVLFVTANLNAGGAQRSLVNLASALQRKLPLEVAVCGNSTSDAFFRVLTAADVAVRRTAESRDCFDHATAILRHVVARRFATVCFWNVDPKVKLLLAKALPLIGVRIVDVSPGAYAFEEMAATRLFQQCIGFDEHEYRARLDRLVHKYRARASRRRDLVIPNGVALPERSAAVMANDRVRIVVSGRVAPSKFLPEIVDAMRLVWRTHPEVELHVLGSAEPRHAEYAQRVIDAVGADSGSRVMLHGAVEDAREWLHGCDLALVLGEHQGSPNAVLEALAAGLAVIANDSGGTRELVVDGRTGVLLGSRDPREIAAAVMRLIEAPRLAQRLGLAGRRHVARRFSMDRMTRAYLELFRSLEHAP